MTEIILCQLKQFSCFGCCGNHWAAKKDVLLQFDRNTKMFKQMSKETFSKRGEQYLSSSGGCKSLIKKGSKIICPLHPKQNDDKDYRDKLCDKNFFCETFKKFKQWPGETQNRFVEFVLAKKLNHYTYSMGMDGGAFLKEFESFERQK